MIGKGAVEQTRVQIKVLSRRYFRDRQQYEDGKVC